LAVTWALRAMGANTAIAKTKIKLTDLKTTPFMRTSSTYKLSSK
jgi:hypothetical protein